MAPVPGSRGPGARRRCTCAKLPLTPALRRTAPLPPPQLPSPPWEEDYAFRNSLQLALRSALNGSMGAPDAAMATEDAEALPAELAPGVVSPPAAGI